MPGSDRERIERLESQLGRLLQDYRIGATLTGPFPVSETFMGLRRVDGTQCYVAGVLSSPAATRSLTFDADTLRACPFYVGSPLKVDRLSIYVGTAIAGNARMGIYDSNKNLYPTKLIIDAGVASHASTGWKDISFGKVTLTRGLKWIALVPSGAPNLSAPLHADAWAILGRTQAAYKHLGWRVAFGYAALPSVFPTGATKITTTTPIVLIRLAT